MSKHWKEKADADKHVDYMSTYHVGGININFEGNKTGEWVYFVRVGSFTFQFVNLEQLDDMIEYVSQKVHPSTKAPNNGLEHYWHSWQERLPKGLLKGPRRDRILTALLKAKTDFTRS